jgi:Transglutaminase-like superfamily
VRAELQAWQRFRGLSEHSRSLVLEAAAALAATWVGLRVVGFRRWKPVLGWFVPERVRPVQTADSAVLGAARAIARFEDAAARHLFLRTNCLERSLVLCWLLERRGIASRLRIGARKQEGRFEAHAWVEVDGTALNEAAEPHLHFAPFEQPIASLETEAP